mmetsp:Transcript_39772/g.71259  ORF Transcript_39772/g.71259 Transcript_39772/m.71259 type:complete len:89 (+) Transcript_39772:78-344(+)
MPSTACQTKYLQPAGYRLLGTCLNGATILSCGHSATMSPSALAQLVGASGLLPVMASMALESRGTQAYTPHASNQPHQHTSSIESRTH